MVMLFDQEYAVKQFGRAQKQEGFEEGRVEGRAEGRAEGHAEGQIEGQIEGQNRLGALITKLFALGRIGDARKAASDADYRDKLYEEFRMV